MFDNLSVNMVTFLDGVARSAWTMVTLPLLLLLAKHVMALYSPLVDGNNDSGDGAAAVLDKYYYFTMCDYNGQKYPPGYFSPEPCKNCNCNATTGLVYCSVRECPQVANCIRYGRTTTDECCPKCIQRGCYHHNKQYLAGEKIDISACEKCYCPWEGGDEKTGAPVCQPIKCPGIRCVDSEVPKNKCCPVCPHGPNCWLDDKVIAEGKRIFIDKCRFCYCSNLEYIYNATRRHATCVRSFFCL